VIQRVQLVLDPWQRIAILAQALSSSNLPLIPASAHVQMATRIIYQVVRA